VTGFTPAELGRLAKICGMFGSDHAGERAAAAMQAAGLTWADVLAANIEPTGPNPDQNAAWQTEMTPAVILAHYGHALSAWETNFLATLIKRPNHSRRQLEVLAKIRERFV
jgi:hypothetical protein